jgi:hypothetical protein
MNWRSVGIQKLANYGPNDFFFSEPMAIGETAFVEIKALLKSRLESSRKLLASETSEKLVCLNLDFFETRYAK